MQSPLKKEAPFHAFCWIPIGYIVIFLRSQFLQATLFLVFDSLLTQYTVLFNAVSKPFITQWLS